MVPPLGSTEMIQISKNTGTSPKALAVQVSDQFMFVNIAKYIGVKVLSCHPRVTVT